MVKESPHIIVGHQDLLKGIIMTLRKLRDMLNGKTELQTIVLFAEINKNYPDRYMLEENTNTISGLTPRFTDEYMDNMSSIIGPASEDAYLKLEEITERGMKLVDTTTTSLYYQGIETVVFDKPKVTVYWFEDAEYNEAQIILHDGILVSGSYQMAERKSKYFENSLPARRAEIAMAVLGLKKGKNPGKKSEKIDPLARLVNASKNMNDTEYELFLSQITNASKRMIDKASCSNINFTALQQKSQLAIKNTLLSLTDNADCVNKLAGNRLKEVKTAFVILKTAAMTVLEDAEPYGVTEYRNYISGSMGQVAQLLGREEHILSYITENGSKEDLSNYFSEVVIKKGTKYEKKFDKKTIEILYAKLTERNKELTQNYTEDFPKKYGKQLNYRNIKFMLDTIRPQGNKAVNDFLDYIAGVEFYNSSLLMRDIAYLTKNRKIKDWKNIKIDENP